MSYNLSPHRTWSDYKADKSSLYGTIATPSKADIQSIYSAQTKIAKDDFNRNMFNVDDKKYKKHADEYAYLVEAVKKDLFQKSVDDFAKQFKDIEAERGDSYIHFQRILKDIVNGKKQDEDITKSLDEMKIYVDKLRRVVQEEIPEFIVNKLRQENKSVVRFNDSAVIELLEPSPAAKTAFLNMNKHLDDLDRYVASKGQGEFKIGEKVFTDADIEGLKSGELARQYGGRFALITGQIFEGILQTGLQGVLSELATIKNVGGSTDGGSRSKDDIAVEIGGQKLMAKLDKIGALPQGTSKNVGFSENIKVGVSAKKKGKKVTNTYLQSTFGAVMALDNNSIPDNMKTLMFHYYQLGGSLPSIDSRNNKMKLLNRYVMAHLANKIIGNSIYFMAFVDEIITKYEFLDYLGGRGKFLNMVDKNTGRTIPGDANSVSGGSVHVNA